MPQQLKNESDRFDVRVLDNRFRRGVLTEAEYKAHLESLPDDAAEAEETTTRFTNAYQVRVDDDN